MKSFREYAIEVDQAYADAETDEALFKKIYELFDEGNPYATYCLGTLYENGIGVEQDNSTALSYYVVADNMGLPEAKYQLGVTCEFGRCGVTQSYEVAAKIYKEAADLGHSDAQCQLGGLYERGYGVEKNIESAVNYYKLASDNQNARAKFLLAGCYMDRSGVARSLTEALNLFHQAADLGHGMAQLMLAARYKYGDDLPRDYIKAYAYADLASKNARNESDKSAAIELRDQIYGLMSDDEKNSVFP